MLIGIDLDSVLADLVVTLNEYHNLTYGTSYEIADYQDYNLGIVWGCSREEAMERVFEFYASPWMEAIPVVPGAREGITYLKRRHQLAVITSRPHLMEAATLRWLNRYFPDDFDHIVLSNQFSTGGHTKKTKSEIGLAIGIEAMIDDHVEFVTDCHRHGIKSYLFEAPWNQHRAIMEGIVRLKNWSAVNRYF